MVPSWLKLGYHTRASQDPHYWETIGWVGDGPGVNSPWWKQRPRPQRGDVYPPYGPRYEVGDQLVMYLTGLKRCPAILEVTRQPYWDPDHATEQGMRSERDRWAVVTEVRHVASVPLAQAPPLERLGIASSSVSRKGHVAMEPWQLSEAHRLIGTTKQLSPDPRNSGAARLVPLERGHVGGYEVTSRSEKSRAERREWRLVRDYADSLRAQGDEVRRNALRLETGTTLFTDLFNETRRHLVEAKAGTSRGEIRMAIGQLADYSRLIDGAISLAVLLEAKPNPDLMALLASQHIEVIWREGDGFADSAGGAFV